MNKKLKTKLERLFTNYNRNLLKELIYADFKAYDRNSILGILWNLLNPAATLLIMYCVFENRFGHSIHFYPFYLLIGVVMVNFFITVTSKMIGSISNNRYIVLNSTIPREDFILADLFVHTYKFSIELVLCWLISIFYGVFAWQAILLILPLLAAYIGLALGVGLIIALLHCIAMDIEHIWRIAARLLLFITPVFYELSHISHLFSKIIYWFNPLTPFLIAFRQLFIWNNALDAVNYCYSICWGFGFLVLGYMIFVAFENVAIERV